MIIDLHAHVTVDVPAQLERAERAGVDRTVMLTTRIHPEAPRTLEGVRAEFARLGTVLGGASSPVEEYRESLAEQRRAIDGHPAKLIGFAQVPIGLGAHGTRQWLDAELRAPGMVGIGELTPPPGHADLIEPVLAASADLGGLPVLVHGFAPHTVEDLRTYAALAARYPTVPVIVGAFGGLNWLHLVDLALERANLYLDCSSALQVFAVRAAATVLPDRCLFGSNTPYGDVLAARATIEAAITDPAVADQVLGGNLLRLIEGRLG